MLSESTRGLLFLETLLLLLWLSSLLMKTNQSVLTFVECKAITSAIEMFAQLTANAARFPILQTNVGIIRTHSLHAVESLELLPTNTEPHSITTCHATRVEFQPVSFIYKSILTISTANNLFYYPENLYRGKLYRYLQYT